VKRTGARLGIVSFLGLLTATISLAMSPLVASAATVKHHGTWHVSGGLANAKSVNTASYGTHNKAKTCVNITSNNSNNNVWWTIRLIWYNAGNNTVLWKLKGVGTGNYCVGWRTMSRPNDKVYDKITADNLQSIKGTYNIWTN
jgi:hypothetical protein